MDEGRKWGRSSARIRGLAIEGRSVAEVARLAGVRYQHAYQVLKGHTPKFGPSGPPRKIALKPTLTTKHLLSCGFKLVGYWQNLRDGTIAPSQPIPKPTGVYAFAQAGIALYVGAATIGLAKRLYFYSRPGPTQHTSQRLNGLIKNSVPGLPIEIYVACPPDLGWNGLPIHGSAGLEVGLIQKYALAWNQASPK